MDVAFSMRALLAADTMLSDDLRATIARRAPDSASQLMTLGLSACEARELLDEPCLDASELPFAAE